MFDIHWVYQESTLSDLFLRLCRIDILSPHLPPLVHLGIFIVIGDTVAWIAHFVPSSHPGVLDWEMDPSQHTLLIWTR